MSELVVDRSKAQPYVRVCMYITRCLLYVLVDLSIIEGDCIQSLYCLLPKLYTEISVISDP